MPELEDNEMILDAADLRRLLLGITRRNSAIFSVPEDQQDATGSMFIPFPRPDRPQPTAHTDDLDVARAVESVWRVHYGPVISAREVEEPPEPRRRPVDLRPTYDDAHRDPDMIDEFAFVDSSFFDSFAAGIAYTNLPETPRAGRRPATTKAFPLLPTAVVDAAPVKPESLTCVVCTNFRVGVTLGPCGHTCVCRDCAKTLQHRNDPCCFPCPICRASVESWLPAYFG
jgi:hypothetical protein